LRSVTVGAGAMALGSAVRAQEGKRRVRVAAVQMHASLGEVEANLDKAERWARRALREGARWVVLPEFFTTGIAYHPTRLLNAYRPLDGPPMQLLKSLAKDGQAYVAGSFLARTGEDVFDTFVLATPNGETFTHDRDFPTSDFEASVFAGGEDDEFVKALARRGVVAEPVAPIPGRAGNDKNAVFSLEGGSTIGAALCWELSRYRTARRLTGRVDLILACSSWPFSAPNVDISRPSRSSEPDMRPFARISELPRRVARMVGAPVIHANLVGETWNLGPRGDGVMRFAGESQIVDGSGQTLARRRYGEGEGLVIAEIEMGRVPPTEKISTDDFWTPEFPQVFHEHWGTRGASGRATYINSTRPRRNASD
jgi:predicted amidohydrolase